MFLLLLLSSCSGGGVGSRGGENYVIRPADKLDPADLKWAGYLHTHLKRRAADAGNIVHFSVGKGKEIVIDVDSDLQVDFRVFNESEHRMHLLARDASTMLWLQYQFMRHAGDNDSRLKVSDLPASLLTFSDTLATFPFEYREVYLPTNQDPDMTGILGLHNLDADWAIWGHNMAKVLGRGRQSRDIFAKVNGKVTEDQFCFTSDKLYELIESYIVNNYGEGDEKSYKVAIFPNDNELTCTCLSCREAGNVKGNAQPAVMQMIRRLAKRFPKHTFFTSDYLTTNHLPKQPLPENAGVIVSAINFPMRAVTNENAEFAFSKRLREWRSFTNRVYVWDYINNFDDYLTPFPVLEAMQHRLKLYKSLGISGIFLNGSGFGFSSFEKLHTHVLSAMLITHKARILPLVEDYFTRLYPVSGGALYAYYADLIEQTKVRHKVMPFYGGTDELKDAYLRPERFVRFYDTLQTLYQHTEEEESIRLRPLMAALTFTRLEVARSAGYNPVHGGFATLREKTLVPDARATRWLNLLEQTSRDVHVTDYSEGGGKVADYVDEWRKYILSPERYENLLSGLPVKAKGRGLDQTIKKLSDGVFGLPCSYHFGWNLFPAREQVTLTFARTQASANAVLRIGFLHQPRHRIHLPARVEVYAGDKLLQSFSVPPPTGGVPSEVVFVGGRLGEPVKGPLTLRILPSYGTEGNIAIDEVQLKEEKG